MDAPENDGLHWPRRDGLKWPHPRRLLSALMFPDCPVGLQDAPVVAVAHAGFDGDWVMWVPRSLTLTLTCRCLSL